MNKHVLLITAYNDFECLIEMIKYYHLHYDCYIHIDKKIQIPNKFAASMTQYPNVFIVQKYKINWGSYKHILAFLELMRLAKNKYEYYHICSGNSFIIKPYSYIEHFFKLIAARTL